MATNVKKNYRLLLLHRDAFLRLADEYLRVNGIALSLCSVDGTQILGSLCSLEEPCPYQAECIKLREQIIQESVRWGEPYTNICPNGCIIWAIPVMENARLLGGILAAAPDNSRKKHLYHSAVDLLNRAIAYNITNAALLEYRRKEAKIESERAETIHVTKDQNYLTIHELYLAEEPILISAIKSGDTQAARESLNRVLTGIYFQGRERSNLLKSFILELIVTMSRSAVEAGGNADELLGANYSSVTELAAIDNEEELCRWLVAMLERMMRAINSSTHTPMPQSVQDAISYMRDNIGEDLSRDAVSDVVSLSPAHFSRLMKQSTGMSFTDLFSHMRIDFAKELLRSTDASIFDVSVKCGYNDQSYFTKVFKSELNQTPMAYRRSKRKSTNLAKLSLSGD